MTVKDIIVTLCKNRQVTQSEFAARLGKQSRSSIAVPLSRNEGMGMKVGTLIEWLDELDCQLVIMQNYDEEEYVLDGDSMGIDYKEDD